MNNISLYHFNLLRLEISKGILLRSSIVHGFLNLFKPRVGGKHYNHSEPLPKYAYLAVPFFRDPRPS